MASETIAEFKDHYRFLSNFWMCPVHYAGVIYPSSEHAYQAAKTLDPVQRQQIQVAATPGDAKKLGRVITIRGDWDHARVNTMRGIIRDKFTRNADLGARLLLTGDSFLVEGNRWHDNFWGACLCGRESCTEGKNWLGLILMEIRTELQ
jgi:ribA/ribD-fused uncharacterized protein